jgi:predicted small secreted protein
MKKSLLITILVAFVLSGCNKMFYGKDKDVSLKEKCCKECLEALNQSPVGIGKQGVLCGEFTTAKPISKECLEYFKKNPTTVGDCESK